MSCYKVNTLTGEILSAQLVQPPEEFSGLSYAVLQDLGPAFPDRSDLSGVGFWEESRVSACPDPMHIAADVWPPVADMERKVVVTTQGVVPKPLFLIQRDVKRLGVEVDAWIDQISQERGYKSIEAVCSYANSANAAWAADAHAAITWRDAVWSAFFATQAQVLAGTVPMMTQGALIASLPKIVWPS